MKKNHLYIALAVLAVAGVGWFVYEKFFAAPDVTFGMIDWPNGQVTYTTSDKKTGLLTAATGAVDIGRGYTMEFIGLSNNMYGGIALKRGPVIVEYLAENHATV